MFKKTINASKTADGNLLSAEVFNKNVFFSSVFMLKIINILIGHYKHQWIQHA